MNELRELTKAEEQVMHAIWKLQKTNVHGIIAEMPEPRPAYNTVSTIVRILEQKGFVGHESKGRAHLYFAKIAKDNYRNFAVTNLVDGYFSGSLSKMVSFFVDKQNMDVSEVDEIIRMIEQQKEQKK